MACCQKVFYNYQRVAFVFIYGSYITNHSHTQSCTSTTFVFMLGSTVDYRSTGIQSLLAWHCSSNYRSQICSMNLTLNPRAIGQWLARSVPPVNNDQGKMELTNHTSTCQASYVANIPKVHHIAKLNINLERKHISTVHWGKNVHILNILSHQISPASNMSFYSMFHSISTVILR